MTRENAKKELANIDATLSIPQMKERAELLVKSGFLPKAIKTAEQAITVMLMGAEYGISPMKSFQSIHIIEGKPTLSAQLMLALCERTGELTDKKIEIFDDRAEVTLTRKGQTPHKATFGDVDARLMKTKEAVYTNGNYTGSKTISLIEKYNYVTMKKDMYVARAISRAARRVFPDAVLGLMVPEEAYDIIDSTAEAKVENEAKEATAKLEHKEELGAGVDAAAGTVHEQAERDALFMRLSAAFIQDTKFYSWYPEKTLGEIISITTPGGKPKGRPFLEKVMAESAKPEDRANIEKFLELVDSVDAGK